MAPIDWNPNGEAGFDGVPGGHRRGPSNASSFHSGNGHGSQEGHSSLPDHDFTAGPANLAPVGGYADLARGPSPQPQMSEHGGQYYGDAYAANGARY